jgi:predicted nucleic acid-binding protein
VNLLIGSYYFETPGSRKRADKQAAEVVRFLRTAPDLLLYVSSFSIIQVIRTLSSNKAIDKASIQPYIAKLVSQYTLIDFTAEDIKATLRLDWKDIEDAYHYTMSRKVGCVAIVTLNTKDFNKAETFVIAAKEVRKLYFGL